MSARLLGAGRIFAIDTIADRLALARSQGAEVIDYNAEDPVESVKRLTGGIGVDCVIDAVGVDANRPHHGPASKQDQQQVSLFERERQQIVPHTNPQNGNWHPGDGPSQVSQWAVQAVAKAGTISIIGLYPSDMQTYPIGQATNKNLHLNMGVCHHRKYIPLLLELVQSKVVKPQSILTQTTSADNVTTAYKAFDKREAGWTKVELLVTK